MLISSPKLGNKEVNKHHNEERRDICVSLMKSGKNNVDIKSPTDSLKSPVSFHKSKFF